jgi:signal transduction histidine kinase
MALRKRALERQTDAALPGSRTAQEFLDREKMTGIIETAVTFNHEVNSPLAVILGHVQLLLRDSKNLDKSIAAKLRVIEASAKRIQTTTGRLLRIIRPDSVEYIEGIRMIDISEGNQRED